MVISKLVGGLGNQMFQYAIARALSVLNDTSLTLDIRAFKDFPERQYALNQFKISAALADDKTLRKIDLLTKTDTSILRRFGVRNYLYIKQKDFDYTYNGDIVRKYDKHIYLDGYWQSENYFQQIGDLIEKDFSLEHLGVDVDLNVLNAMEQKNSVSVHVRRGDYIANHISNEFHGVIGLDYYKNAINLIQGKVHNACFFIFSDDIDWCRSNLDFNKDLVFVENKDERSVYQDLYMMTRCKHHIIANSSFSWWGAWLGSNKGSEIVVAPENWFNKKSKWYIEHSISTKDVVPGNWIKL